MKKLACASLILLLAGINNSLAQEIMVNSIKDNNTVKVDGIIMEGEWKDANFIEMNRTDDWKLKVYFTRDMEYLYVGFKNLVSEKNGRLSPEILISTSSEVGDNWDQNTFWFHSSHGNCEGVGDYYTWKHCGSETDGWEANTLPFDGGNDNIEFKISFSKLQMRPKQGDKIRIAFKLSNVHDLATYWPSSSEISSPSTWGFLNF